MILPFYLTSRSLIVECSTHTWHPTHVQVHLSASSLVSQPTCSSNLSAETFFTYEGIWRLFWMLRSNPCLFRGSHTSLDPSTDLTIFKKDCSLFPQIITGYYFIICSINTVYHMFARQNYISEFLAQFFYLRSRKALDMVICHKITHQEQHYL